MANERLARVCERTTESTGRQRRGCYSLGDGMQASLPQKAVGDRHPLGMYPMAG